MSKPIIIKEEPMSLTDVREELNKIKSRDKELGFRAGKTEDYLNQFARLSENQAAELEKKLNSLKIPRFKDVHIKKIISTLPKTIDDLKLLLQGYTVTIKEDALKKILKAIEDSGVLK